MGSWPGHSGGSGNLGLQCWWRRPGESAMRQGSMARQESAIHQGVEKERVDLGALAALHSLAETFQSMTACYLLQLQHQTNGLRALDIRCIELLRCHR